MYKRNRYSYAFRLGGVESVVKANRSVKAVAREQGFSESHLRLWVGFYKTYGKLGLKPRDKQQYDKSFKLAVLKAIDKEHLSLRSAAVRFTIASESIIISWQKALREKGEAGLIAKPKGRPKKMKPAIKRKQRKAAKPLSREAELLREKEYLRAENELLKKLQALAPTNKKQKL